MARKKRGNSEGSIYKLQDGRWREVVSLGHRTRMIPSLRGLQEHGESRNHNWIH